MGVNTRALSAKFIKFMSRGAVGEADIIDLLWTEFGVPEYQIVFFLAHSVFSFTVEWVQGSFHKPNLRCGVLIRKGWRYDVHAFIIKLSVTPC